MIFYVLIFFSGSAFITNTGSTKAAPSSSFVSTDSTPTPTDTATPMATPIPTAIPTSTSTPTPTSTSTPTPTDTPEPTRTPRRTPTPQDNPTDNPTPTDTSTPTPTPQPTSPAVTPPPAATNGVVATPTATTTSTATPTTVPPLSMGPDDHSGLNPIQTQPVNPGLRSQAGLNGFGLSLGLGAPAFLLLGGGLFWLYLRRHQQGIATVKKGKIPGLTTHNHWVSRNSNATNNAFQQTSDTFTAAIVPTPSFPYGTLLSNASNQDTVPEANMLQQSISPSPAELAAPLYGSSDLRPMTMALPKQVINQPASVLQPYPATSDMSPLPLEAFGPPRNNTQFMEAQHMLDNPVPGALPLDSSGLGIYTSPPGRQQEPMAFLDPLEGTEMTNSPLATPPSAAIRPLSIQPPDVAVDLMLHNVMRQAQTGLFIIPGKTKR